MKDTKKTLPYAKEREQFRALLIENTNYFGNVEGSSFQPVTKIQADTTYEEIGCVGFQPEYDRLEAVVYIKQTEGYWGDVCSQGTPEYVRFYLSTDDGDTWDDLGMENFTAYDIPEATEGPNRLEYAVTLDIEPKKIFCYVENLVLVRAILSWNAPPPPNKPNFIPVWGDIHNTNIQISPHNVLTVGEIFKELKLLEVEPALPFEKFLDLNEKVPVMEPKEVTLLELAEIYKDKDVEPHRFAMKELQKFISEPAIDDTLMTAESKGLLSELGIKWSESIESFNPTDSNTGYEELECIGLDPNYDYLVGVIRVKLPYGYRGDLCSTGSREYVTFWADFNNNGIFEIPCLGTASVNVHDIQSIPEEGLEYAVFLPLDLSKYRKPCDEGPVVVRIRAILSWDVVPPCYNPNFIPVWGNRLETLIHIKPGPTIEPGTHQPFFQTIGSMHVTKIDDFSGYASGSPLLPVSWSAVDSPFGGRVEITGHITDAPHIIQNVPKLKYRITYSEDGSNWRVVDTPFDLSVDKIVNGVRTSLPDIRQNADNGWFEYLEDLKGNVQYFPAKNILGIWRTRDLNGLYYLKIEVQKPTDPNIIWSETMLVMLDNTRPEAEFTITSGDPCGDFTIGVKIEGEYKAMDLHFRDVGLSAEPPLGIANFTTYVQSTFPAGQEGTWELDTSLMPRCGYVIKLTVRDWTIVNSNKLGWRTTKPIGLCLREPDA